jgi:cell division protein FtsB
MTSALWIERGLPAGLLVVALVSVPLMIWSDMGLPRLHRLELERQGADRHVSLLSAEIRRLRAEVERIKSDPADVERVARDELGLVRQTEIVFQFKR